MSRWGESGTSCRISANQGYSYTERTRNGFRTVGIVVQPYRKARFEEEITFWICFWYWNRIFDVYTNQLFCSSPFYWNNWKPGNFGFDADQCNIYLLCIDAQIYNSQMVWEEKTVIHFEIFWIISEEREIWGMDYVWELHNESYDETGIIPINLDIIGSSWKLLP